MDKESYTENENVHCGPPVALLPRHVSMNRKKKKTLIFSPTSLWIDCPLVSEGVGVYYTENWKKAMRLVKKHGPWLDEEDDGPVKEDEVAGFCEFATHGDVGLIYVEPDQDTTTKIATISHECIHMACYLLRYYGMRVRVDIAIGGSEELLCRYHDHIMRPILEWVS